MNVNYYNEFDKGAAAWLRELISAKLIPFGYVDERSITEVTASDVQGFTQCHFFAGIGGWSYALQLAGVPATVPLWTGSPPCQPFSVAGAGGGKRDSRHLAPAFLDLVAECRPQLIFGEQVAAAVKKDQWADSLLIELAEEGYASGFTVLPACSVGAPHKRDRLFFGANQLGYANSERHNRQHALLQRATEENMSETTRSSEASSAAYADDAGLERRQGVSECTNKQSAGPGGVAGKLADTVCKQFDGCRTPGEARRAQSANRSITDSANTHNGFWSDADWLGCRDGKFRPVESGTFPLANGIPARVGRLRGYGNAIVPQVAAEFVKAFMAY